jgi:integrase/recombinase XerD
MSDIVGWQALVDEFLSYRSGLGYDNWAYKFYLSKFARYAEQQRAKHLTTQLAIDWICTFKEPDTRKYLETYLRMFAKFCLKSDSRTEVLLSHTFGRGKRRKIPHIFSDGELAELQKATASLYPRSGLRPSTYRAIFGLLASSGLRVAEAIRLTISDVDLTNGVLSIRNSKRLKSRFVPLHPTTIRALTLYARKREKRFPSQSCERFFVTDGGKALGRHGPDYALRCLAKKLHWQVRGDYKMHRCRDLRHTFIVRNITKSLSKGQEFDNISLALATYVGHDNISYTYWYMSAIPELMSVASRRFRACAKELP